MSSSSSRHVSVRMYNVGFGDCFLLGFPGPDRRRTVLVDCGHHQAGPPPHPLARVVDQVVSDLTEDGRPRVDVVVCTHRHRDHVLGFESGRWDEVSVGEVWMPWTEDPDDPEATKIRNAQARKALALQQALAARAAGDEVAARALEVVETSLTNAAARSTLHHGFAGSPRRRFLPGRQGGAAQRRLVATAALPGVKVHVLGPARDRDTIRNLDPPVDEAYLRLAAAGGAGRGCGLDESWSISPRGDRFGGWLKATRRAAETLPAAVAPLRPSDPDFVTAWLGSLGLTGPELRKLGRHASQDLLAAAASIEQAVNGTSLMLVFELGRAVLLFPGDAQWGTWHRALEDPTWRSLLGRTTFLKVAHHASHNATPRRFLEAALPPGLVAMVPTRRTTRFPDIPRQPLLERLTRTARAVLRSDSPVVAAPFERVNPYCVEARVGC